MSDPQEEELIANFERSPTEELRVTLSSYRGHRYVGLRVWALVAEEDWRPVVKKGCSIRLKELEGIHDAIGYILQRLTCEAQG